METKVSKYCRCGRIVEIQTPISSNTPVKTYTIIATLMTLVVSHACGEILDKDFSKRVEEETINLLCIVE